MTKGLEALKDLREVRGWNDKELNKRLDIIENELKRLEVYDKCNYQTTIHKDVLQISKELEALKIIRKKFVNIVMLINSNNVDEYNKTHYDDLSLTKEEFDLLKEVLL